MKLIAMMLALGVLGGQAMAAESFDLNGVGAAEAAARGGQNLPPIPQFPPIFPPNNWPGQQGFPQNPHGGLDTCEYTGFENGKCLFKCASGAVITEPPVKTGSAGAEAPVCASHVFLSLPAYKSARTIENVQSVELAAADGSRIMVDYVPADLGGKVNATHVWVSVLNPKFSGGEKVTARLSNYYDAKPDAPEGLKDSTEQELLYNGWTFHNRFPDLSIFESFHSWQNNFHQALKVTVNGRELRPKSGAPEFRFTLPGKPAWAEKSVRSAGRLNGCLLSGTEGETCVYKCEGGKGYARPMNRPSPFGDEPVVPCPAFVVQF